MTVEIVSILMVIILCINILLMGLDIKIGVEINGEYRIPISDIAVCLALSFVPIGNIFVTIALIASVFETLGNVKIVFKENGISFTKDY